ncbi:hypothetical protein DY000_02041830 [Brassica cretica]|uniref:FBD domain-containing protein n=1 Tax=Brassica cretica TaxID=69181 RepID=A0ABQ7BPQ0_BRACR|nr:hypothetical protein DY000_02041830 [Brassica cretica]
MHGLMSYRCSEGFNRYTATELRLEPVIAASHFVWPQEEKDTLEYHIDDDEPYVEEPFDESILTPEQSVKVDELCKENPMLTREDMAVMFRLNLMSHRATLEGRELTSIEIRMAQQLKEVFYWVPPTQLEGICNSTLELHFEDICLPSVEEIASDLNSHVLINKCLDLICETRKLDDLRVEKLVKDHIEVCFDKNYLCASIDFESEFLMLDEPRLLLELADLGDELDVDRLLLEIENPLVKNFHENENIVFYLIDGDRVDYFVKTSFEPVVKFVFPPNALDSHDHLNFKEQFIIHVTSLVKLFEEKSVYFLWTVVCSFAYLVDELCKENPILTWEDMAVMLRLNLMSHRATLEGRELTGIEIRMAQQLKEIASDLNSHMLINECLDLICETRKLDDLRVEKLVRDHIEVCFDKNYLCASIDLDSEFLMFDEPRPLLELADLGDELDVDRLLFEIENPLVKNFHENENIVFYLIDGDRVDNFVKTSFKPVVEFVSPPNAFDSYDHLKLKEHFIIPVTSLVLECPMEFLEVFRDICGAKG